MKKTVIVSVKIPTVLRPEHLMDYVSKGLAARGVEATGLLVGFNQQDGKGNLIAYARGEAEARVVDALLAIRRKSGEGAWTPDGFRNRGIGEFCCGGFEPTWSEADAVAKWRSHRHRPYDRRELLAYMKEDFGNLPMAPVYLVYGLYKCLTDGTPHYVPRFLYAAGWLVLRPFLMPIVFALDERRQTRLLRDSVLEFPE